MSKTKALILICDDDRSLCEILENALSFDGYNTEIAHTGESALDRIFRNHHDLVLLDLKLPDMSGLDILKSIQKMEVPPKAVMISGEGDIHSAVEATKIGAYDFLEKPLDSDRVLLTIKNALERSRLEQEKHHLLESVMEQYRMVGQSSAMNTIQNLITKAARTSSKVLIQGPNGTGKELVARAIHHRGSRAAGPFVAVNCAAIPENLIESELFGHKKGAFTGAILDKPGRFEVASGGTIFLDEIGDMSLMTQAKVLRTLEESTIEAVGGSEVVTVDTRVIAATNKNLQEEMAAGNFREDLYFRLNVLNIHVPALHERKEDIPLLIEYYIHQFCNEHGVRLKTIHPKAMDMLIGHHWPGNVRELKNVAEKMVILVESPVVRPVDIDAVLQTHVQKGRQIDLDLPLKDARDAFEKHFIENKLLATGWNVTRSAELLGVPRTYLHKLIKKFEIPHQPEA